MKVSEEIKKINLDEEFRVCPQCSYGLGFHSSFLRSEKGYRINSYLPGLRSEV